MEYTKGSWSWVQYHDAHTALNRTANLKPGDKRTVLYHAAEWEMLPADKNLIAAAPDMYEALKELLEDIRITEAFESNSFGELTRMVEQALARAEGRTDQ